MWEGLFFLGNRGNRGNSLANPACINALRYYVPVTQGKRSLGHRGNSLAIGSPNHERVTRVTRGRVGLGNSGERLLPRMIARDDRWCYLGYPCYPGTKRLPAYLCEQCVNIQ